MNPQKIAVISAQGYLGHNLLEEALNRDNTVTAIVNDASSIIIEHDNLAIREGNIKNATLIAKHIKGHDVVICAHEPSRTHAQDYIDIVKATIEAAKMVDIKRIIITGHPQEVENSPEFHESWRPVLIAQKEILKHLQSQKDLDWSFAHTAELEPEKTTGKFRVSNLLLLSNAQGQSRVPVKSYAAALMDEAGKSEFVWEVTGIDI